MNIAAIIALISSVAAVIGTIFSLVETAETSQMRKMETLLKLIDHMRATDKDQPESEKHPEETKALRGRASEMVKQMTTGLNGKGDKGKCWILIGLGTLGAAAVPVGLIFERPGSPEEWLFTTIFIIVMLFLGALLIVFAVWHLRQKKTPEGNK